MKESFLQCQQVFLDAQCHEFDENSEEHKLDHTVLFKKYVSIVENNIEKAMEMKIQHLQIKNMLSILEKGRKRLENEYRKSYLLYLCHHYCKRSPLPHSLLLYHLCS